MGPGAILVWGVVGAWAIQVERRSMLRFALVSARLQAKDRETVLFVCSSKRFVETKCAVQSLQVKDWVGP